MEAKVKKQETRRTQPRALSGVRERMQKPNPETPIALLLTSCFLLLASCLWAAEEPGRVEKTLDTTPNPRVSVSNVRGNVVVKGWDKSQVHALFTATSSKVGVDIEPTPPKGQADRVRFQTETPNASMNTGESADYSLDVPMNSTLDIQDTQGSVRVEKVQGDVHVYSVAAPISVTEALGHLHVESVGGNIEIVRASGRVEASTVNGDIRFASLNSADLHGITTSGRIVYQGDFVPRGNYDLATYSGEVDVFCPATASFELRAKTKGKVENDFRMTSNERGARSASPYYTSFFGTYHEGKATLDVRSYNGAIHIHRQP
jgi:DUF4097 and DUF4098 domain-containing protein YvlB